MGIERSDVTTQGCLGESIAAQYLMRKGWTIISRNWQCRYGELDIVAMPPVTDNAEGGSGQEAEPNTVVFVEVKYRSSVVFGTGIEAVTHSKLEKLRRAAQLWLVWWRKHGSSALAPSPAAHAGDNALRVRFDLIDVGPAGVREHLCAVEDASWA